MRRRQQEPSTDGGIPAHLRPGSSLWAADTDRWRQERLDWSSGDREKLLAHGTNPLEWLRETMRFHRGHLRPKGFLPNLPRVPEKPDRYR